MHVKNLVICDPQKQYSINLLQIFRTRKQEDYQYYLFHSQEELQKFAEKKRIHILLIAEEIPKNKRDEIKADKKIILVKQEKRSVRGEKSVCRYQCADEIWKQIHKGAAKKKVVPVKKGNSGAAELIAVYSPVHRIGKTRFALELGKKFAEKEPVLYLNLEEYSGGEFYFPESQKQNLGDLFYYLRQEKGNLGMRISIMAGQHEGLDYILPMPCVQDLRTVAEEEWLLLCEKIARECIYGKVILDLGDSVNGLYQILKKCDSIYTPYIDEPSAAAKMRQYTENIRKMGLEEILEKTIQKRMEREGEVE